MIRFTRHGENFWLRHCRCVHVRDECTVDVRAGVAYTSGVYCLRRGTDGHLNPAVTVALTVLRRLSTARCASFLCAQFFGQCQFCTHAIFFQLATYFITHTLSIVVMFTAYRLAIYIRDSPVAKLCHRRSLQRISSAASFERRLQQSTTLFQQMFLYTDFVFYLFVILQGVSIACYAEPCISYDRVVRPSVCLSVTRWHCQNDASSQTLHRRIAQGL